jgi:hypothetical protein
VSQNSIGGQQFPEGTEVLEFKEVKIWAFAKIKSYFSRAYVKITLFKVLKKAYPIDFIRLTFTKTQKISLSFSTV